MANVGRFRYAMMRQESFARAEGLAETHGGPNGGPNGGPKIGDSRLLSATGGTIDNTGECALDLGNPRQNARLATAGHSSQNDKDRPGRT